MSVMKIKKNKKSVIVLLSDNGKYKLDLTSLKIYDITEKGKSRKLECLFSELENALYDMDFLKDSDIKHIKFQMKFE